MTVLAKIISWVFHPLWVPLYLFLYLISVDPYLGMQPAVTLYVGVVLVVSILATVLSLLMLRRSRGISDLEVSVRSERFVPFFIVLIYQAMVLWTIHGAEAYIPVGWFALFQGQLILLTIALLITIKFKASMHLMGQGGALAALAFFNAQHSLGLDMLLPVGFIGAGLVGWARSKQGVHTLPELAVGFALGLFGLTELLGALM
ncbi:MAG: hypothetical protein P8M07_01010 [Flavobacteriales bacterium]|nr:hypothetical protein [Flavobacteriales bacterium]